MKKLLKIFSSSLVLTGIAYNGAGLVAAAKLNYEILTNSISNPIKYAEPIQINRESVQFIKFDNKGDSFMATKSGLYFLEYNKTKKEKIIGINDIVQTIEFIDNDTYVGTKNGAYIIKHNKLVATKISNLNNENVWTIDVINKNIYFGTNTGAYILKIGETVANKIKNLDAQYVRGTKLGNKMYFATFNEIFVLSDGEITATKINAPNYFFSSKPLVVGQKIYFFSLIHSYCLVDGKINATKIEGLDYSSVHSFAVANNSSNIYLGTNYGLYILKNGETTATKITDVRETVWTIKIMNNDVYFGTDFGAYVLKKGETVARQFNEIVGKISLIASYNNELYLAGEDDIVYHLKESEINVIRLRNHEVKGIKHFYFDEKNNNIYIQQQLQDIYLLIDKKKMANNEIVEKWYKFLAPDELKIKLTFYQLEELTNQFESKEQSEFITWLINTIKSIPEIDHSGLGGSITNADFKTIANLIYTHYSNIYTKFQQMESKDDLIIVTTTNGYWNESNLIIVRNL